MSDSRYIRSRIVAGVISGVIVLLFFKFGGLAWRHFGWWGVVFGTAGAYLALRSQTTGYQGLDQWPDPHGRYYDEWLRLPEGTGGDYYEWLSRRMGGREPWASWAKAERALTDDATST